MKAFRVLPQWGRSARHLLAVSPRPSLGLRLLLALALWGAVVLSGLSAASRSDTLVVAPATEADWLGRTRDDVLATLGKPLSALQRGEVEVLMYANDVRVEIRHDVVVAFRGGRGPAIVASDGTRYHATARGKVERVLPAAAPGREKDESGVATVPAGSAASPSPSSEVPEVPPDSQADDIEAMTDPLAAGSGDFVHPFATAAEELADRGLLPHTAEKSEAPGWHWWVTEIGSVLLRLGFAVLILRIAISWVELPCYLPDVLKVSVLFVVIREGIHGLSQMGGHWQWIELFRLADVASFFGLSILLVQFKIALSGLTALKIAIATVGASYFLMLIVAVGLSFLLG